MRYWLFAIPGRFRVGSPEGEDLGTDVIAAVRSTIDNVQKLGRPIPLKRAFATAQNPAGLFRIDELVILLGCISSG